MFCFMRGCLSAKRIRHARDVSLGWVVVLSFFSLFFFLCLLKCLCYDSKFLCYNSKFLCYDSKFLCYDSKFLCYDSEFLSF